MGLFGWLRRDKPRRYGSGSLDRQATDADLTALREFVESRQGVEFYLEPRTSVTATTVLAIAADGEWTRRRVGSPEQAGWLADKLAIPLYETMRVGYPQRMRDWNAAHPERRLR